MMSEKNEVKCLFVVATTPTTEFFPAWQTSIPMTITLLFLTNVGSLTLSDSPPTLELTYFMMFVATDMFNF